MLNVDAAEAPELPISWNVAPTQLVYAAVTAQDGTPRSPSPPLGARPELGQGPEDRRKVDQRPVRDGYAEAGFPQRHQGQRALLPVSGFYEWRRPEPGAVTAKQPFYFHRADGSPLVFAGLWEAWRDAEGRPLRTCTIITTTANKIMAPVHNRMPVVLPADVWDEWLRPEPLRPSRLNELLAPAPENLFDVHPVSTAVNKAGNDGPELIVPVPRFDTSPFVIS